MEARLGSWSVKTAVTSAKRFMARTRSTCSRTAFEDAAFRFVP